MLEEFLHPGGVPADVGVNLAVGAFQVRVGDQGRTTVSRADDIDHVQVVFLDDPVQVDIEEVEAWRGSPVAKEARLDVRPREHPGLFVAFRATHILKANVSVLRFPEHRVRVGVHV